jgi:hypothetical protein
VWVGRFYVGSILPVGITTSTAVVLSVNLFI